MAISRVILTGSTYGGQLVIGPSQTGTEVMVCSADNTSTFYEVYLWAKNNTQTNSMKIGITIGTTGTTNEQYHTLQGGECRLVINGITLRGSVNSATADATIRVFNYSGGCASVYGYANRIT